MLGHVNGLVRLKVPQLACLVTRCSKNLGPILDEQVWVGMDQGKKTLRYVAPSTFQYGGGGGHLSLIHQCGTRCRVDEKWV